jgi:hypothetical protein
MNTGISKSMQSAVRIMLLSICIEAGPRLIVRETTEIEASNDEGENPTL